MSDLHTLDRDHHLAHARRLSIFTIAWNVTEGAIAITAGVIANSGALTGFGLDSGIESISAGVLLWRIQVERNQPQRAEHVERTASRLIGASFLVLAAYVAYDAVSTLLTRDKPDTSIIGIALTVVSIIVMPVLAHRKRHVANQLDSHAAHADGTQTMACFWLSAVVLAGLALNATLEWWWADPLAALGVVAFLMIEGREAITAEELDDCC